MSDSDPKFKCEGCGKQYKWKPEMAGKKAKCKCGHALLVPAKSPVKEESDLYDLAPIEAPAPVRRQPAVAVAADGGSGGGIAMATASPAVAAPSRTAIGGAATMGQARQPMVPPGRRSLSYATPSNDGPPLLGDCPIEWVMHLRNASTLMVWVINVNFLGMFLPNMTIITAGIGFVTTLMSAGAAWLLTMPEPGAAASQSWFSVRLLLRGVAMITAVGETIVAVALLIEMPQMALAGGILSLAMVPQTFLFLFYLRKLALRIPNMGLAINAAIVMIGLPVLVGLAMAGTIFAARGGSAGLAILSGLGALVGLLVFRVWYLILLIWFNRSFS